MHWFTAFLLFVLVWWLVLFAVLPLWTRPIDEASQVPGGWRGVPAQARLGRKMIVTTLVAALVWGGCMVVISSDWISFRTGWLALQGE